MTTRKAQSALRVASSSLRTAESILGMVDAWAPRQNHPAWYSHLPVDGLVNLNFGRRETALQANPDSKLMNDGGAYMRLTPLDAVITLELSRPRALGRTDALDEAAGIILNQMRAVATTTTPYTKADIIEYLENCRYIMAAYAMARRIADCMGLADAYDADAYFKYALMAFPYGTKWSQVYPERAQLDAALASLTPVLRNLFPAKVDCIERMKWLFSNIFVDSASKKYSAKCFKANRWEVTDENGVVHIFVMMNEDGLKLMAPDSEDPLAPVVVDTTTEGTTPFGSYAICHVVPATPLGLIQAIREMVGIMTQSAMTSRIAGDLLKAFGQEAFMQIPPYEPGKQCPFVFDEDVLNQIQNIATTNVVNGYDPINHIPTFLGASNATLGVDGRPVTTYRNEIEAARVMAITRLSPYLGNQKYWISEEDPAESFWVPHTAGTEIVEQYCYVTVTGNAAANEQVLVPHSIYAAPLVTLAEKKLILEAWSSDDWAPMTHIILDSSATRVFLIDAQNWALMTEKDQAVFTNVATLSLYTIPYLVSKQDTFAFVN